MVVVSSGQITITDVEDGRPGLKGDPGPQGLPGPAGADGRTPYIHIAYADNEKGTVGFSVNPSLNKLYIGIYTDYEQVDSTDPTKYKWQRIVGPKGSDGLPGPAGADGRTPYIHFAYSNSADGSKDFSVDNQEYKQYIGVYQDYTQADSADYKTYKWSLIKGEDGQHGANILLDTNEPALRKNYASYDRYLSNVSAQPFYDINFVKVSVDDIPIIRNGLNFKVKPGAADKTVAMCWYIGSGANGISVTVGNTYTISCYAFLVNGAGKLRLKMVPGLITTALDEKLQTEPLGTVGKWIQYSTTFTVDTKNVEIVDGKTRIYIGVTPITNDGAEVILCGFKVEEGDHATQYAPSRFETDIELGRKADADSVIEQQRLLKESQDKALQELNDDIMRRVSTDWADLIKKIKETDENGRKHVEEEVRTASARLRSEASQQFGEYAYIKEFITTDQIATEEGLSIGKRDNSERILITPNRISFMSAGKEIASIAQGRLNIDSGAFTLSLQIGRFITFQDPSDPTRNITKYIEG
nr:MAG TPA: tail protein [Caudoviricetes sp.]